MAKSKRRTNEFTDCVGRRVYEADVVDTWLGDPGCVVGLVRSRDLKPFEVLHDGGRRGYYHRDQLKVVRRG